jgi:hypothetical protein
VIRLHIADSHKICVLIQFNLDDFQIELVLTNLLQTKGVKSFSVLQNIRKAPNKTKRDEEY